MEEKIFCLMHRDDPVCAIVIDLPSGAILRVSKPVCPELLPPGGNTDSAALRKWWQRRAVPMSQDHIRRILDRLGIVTPQEYLVKNLGLSLTDHYWIKPLDMELGWQDVNLFENHFRDSVDDMHLENPIHDQRSFSSSSFSPSSATQGDLQKKWIIADEKRCLVKGNHGSNSQESLNEVAAALIHKKQDRQPYVSYSTIRSRNRQQLYCICESFTSGTTEFIPAIDIVNLRKKSNSTSVYEHFIQICTDHGLDMEIPRAFLEYQILTDFILTNTDRHLGNFGILRDTKTLQFTGMAPIFDSGNSMFWQNPRLPECDDLTDITVNSFRQKEKQLLSYVNSCEQLDFSKLPTFEELQSIYRSDPLISYVDSILLGYQKKKALLEKFYKI